VNPSQGVVKPETQKKIHLVEGSIEIRYPYARSICKITERYKSTHTSSKLGCVSETHPYNKDKTGFLTVVLFEFLIRIYGFHVTI
jgi:hypothetical protein